MGEEEGHSKFVLDAAEGEQDHGCSWHKFGWRVLGEEERAGRERPSARHLRCRISETADFKKISELNSLPDSPLNGPLKSDLGNVFRKYTEALQKEAETLQSCT